MKLSDRPLAGRPDDLAAENRELHRLRAQASYLQDVALAARAMLDLNPKVGRAEPRPIGWLTLMRALDQLEMGGVALPDTARST